jgi:hypothetical protein
MATPFLDMKSVFDKGKIETRSFDVFGSRRSMSLLFHTADTRTLVNVATPVPEAFAIGLFANH